MDGSNLSTNVCCLSNTEHHEHLQNEDKGDAVFSHSFYIGGVCCTFVARQSTLVAKVSVCIHRNTLN